MGIGKLGSFFNVLDQIHPGGRKPLIRLRTGTAFNQRFHNPCCRDLFAASVEDLFLKLGDKSISFVAQLDG
jgi:hypothetical protein